MTAPPTGSGARFDLDAVRVRFGDSLALDGVALEVRPGEALALVGPSGSGKTTLLRLLNGALRPDEGRVRVDDRPLRDLSPRQLAALRARIGFVHQDLRLVPNLRVCQNVISGRVGQQSLLASLRAFLAPSRPMLEEVYAVLARVGIAEKLFERTDRLSGGQQQRVALARALFQGPRALLADEPVSSVDPARAESTMELLTSVSRERGLTLIVSLHQLALAQRYFSRLVGLRRGRIVFDRGPSEISEADLAALYDLSDLSSAELLEAHG